MNVARLLQDSPSDDHRRRQELREKQERERVREREDDRERERGRDLESDKEREKEHERSREWDRAQRGRSSLSSAPTAPPSTHRPYSPLDNTLPPRSRLNASDNQQLLPPRSAPNMNESQNHAYAHSLGSDTMHARSYSQDSRPPSSSHSRRHSPPDPLFLSPLTAPRDHSGPAAAGRVPGTAPNNASPDYQTDHSHRANKASQPMQGKPPPPQFAHAGRERDRELERRARSLSGSARPRSPPYGEYHDSGRMTPAAGRSGPGQHSPGHGSYSVVPPSHPSPPQHHFSPPLSGSLNNSSSSLHRAHVSQGPPLSRRPPQPPTSLPPPPSAALKNSHDSSGAPTGSAMGRPLDELPYLARAPSSSSSMMNVGRERTLKEDIERERESLERERDRERERERERGRELQRNASSRSTSAGTPAHASPPNSFGDRAGEREREAVDADKMREMDAIRAARLHGQPREAREREALRHHHHHHHHHTVSHPHLYPHSHPNQSLHPQQPHPQQQQQQQPHPQQQQQQPLPLIPGTPYTYAHTGKPRISRSGVLKLAPPGVTVANNVPPTSSDTAFAGTSGVILRTETLTLAPASHGHGPQQQPPAHSGPSGAQAIDPIPVSVKQASPPPATLHLHPEAYAEGSRIYSEGPHGYPDHAHVAPHLQQHPSQLSKHKSYGIPTGPGVPPPNGGPPHPGSIQASIISAQQHQQQHAQQFGSAPTHQQLHHPHPHQQSLPPPPPQFHPSSSPNGIHSQGTSHPHPHSNHPYRHMPSGIPPQQQGYPPIHFEDGPPPPVPMTLQPHSPPMQEPGPTGPPLHLGTFVFPRIPFPYFFPSHGNSDVRRSTAPSTSPGQSKKSVRREAELAMDQRERPTHVTILIPSAHLPSSLPMDGRPRIWGGAALPVSSPWSTYVNFVARTVRRIYTDDSDIALCALHSGRVSWAGIGHARAVGLDLAVRLALHRDVGRYVGGPSAFADGSAALTSSDVDAGLKRLLDGKSVKEVREGTQADTMTWLMAHSASWDSGHDGSGFEVLSAEWIPRGATRKLGLRNRSQRLREYTERRTVIMKEVPSDDLTGAQRSTPTVLGKRSTRRLNSTCNSVCQDEERMYAIRTVVFGKYHKAESIGFKYDPDVVRLVLFSVSPSVSSIDRSRGRRKRRRLDSVGRTEAHSDADTDVEMSTVRSRRASSAPLHSVDAKISKDVIFENEEERFLLVLQGSHESLDEDKENRDTLADGADLSAALRKGRRGRRYNLYCFPSPSPSPPPTLSADRRASSEAGSAGNGDGAQKPEVDVPMTPKSNRSEPGSPRTNDKALKAGGDSNLVSKDDTAEATSAAANGVSEPAVKSISIPTPPATTETVHAPSPPPRPINAANDKSEYTKAPQILYRDLSMDNFSFSDEGLSIAGVGRISENGAEERKSVFIHVDRWRWAGSRDFIVTKIGSRMGKEEVAGLGVS